MSQQGPWTNEKRQERAMIDAIRGMLGMDPLYNQEERPGHLWLTMQTAVYQESRQGMTLKKQSSK